MSNKSLDIIHDEHRALAAMLSGGELKNIVDFETGYKK